GLDALGDGDLALAAEQLHRAHLAQVHAYRIVGAVVGAFLGRRLGDGGLLAHRDFAALGLLGVFFRLDDVDAHLREHRQGVLDRLGAHLFARQDLVQLVHRDGAAGRRWGPRSPRFPSCSLSSPLPGGPSKPPAGAKVPCKLSASLNHQDWPSAQIDPDPIALRSASRSVFMRSIASMPPRPSRLPLADSMASPSAAIRERASKACDHWDLASVSDTSEFRKGAPDFGAALSISPNNAPNPTAARWRARASVSRMSASSRRRMISLAN